MSSSDDRTARRPGRAWIALACGLSLLACRSDPPEPTRAEPTEPREPPPVKSPAAQPDGEQPGDREDLLAMLPKCEIEHQGRLLDFGTDAIPPWSSFRLLPDRADSVSHERSTYLRVPSRELAYRVWLDSPLEKPRLSLRTRAGAAKRLLVTLDGRRLPVVRLPESGVRIVELADPKGPLSAGLHSISLLFQGAPRQNQAPLADLDWLRFSDGAEPAPEEGYAPPTFEDITEDLALAGTPRKSLVLRSPSTVRCFIRPSADAQLRVALGFWGAGKGVGEVWVRRDGAEAVVLDSKRLAGGDAAAWTPVELDLGRFAGELVALEFRSLETTRGGRVAFGDPEIVRKKAEIKPEPRAKLAVLVLMSSVARSVVPPWGKTGGLSGMSELARVGVAFSRHRSPTTVPTGVLATLLTGLLPNQHTVNAPLHRLPAGIRTLGKLVKEANGAAAMFTAVPTSFAPFGFDQGWDQFAQYSPVNDIPSAEPFTRAAEWIGREIDENRAGPYLVVIHARGAHPPWDVPREEAARLKPDDYSGAIEPRRGAMILAGLRERVRRGTKRLLADDWTRIRALSEAALTREDAGLRQVFAALKQHKLWDSSLIVVQGDVSPGVEPEVPFADSPPLDEERLGVPLLVKFPGQALAGREIHAPTSAVDVARTIMTSLDLDLPRRTGTELFARATGRSALADDAQTAGLPNLYATRAGTLRLAGAFGETPRLCALDVDPACAVDVLAAQPIAARALWLFTFAAESLKIPQEMGRGERTPVELDDETRAALTVWGDLNP
jgi:arylsulfatase A-like enzyme